MRTIHANRSENQFRLPEKVIKSVLKFDTGGVRIYRQKDVLTDRLAERHKFPAERIFLGEGGLGIMEIVLSSRLRENPSILLPQFGYEPYHQIAKREGAKIETFNFIGYGVSFYYDLEDLGRRLKQKPGLLVLIDPESPLGFSIRNNDLESILKRTHPETLVLVDQAHEGIRTKHTKDTTKLLSEYPNIIVLRSFSKLYGLASLRVGYGLAGDEAFKHLRLPLRRLGFPSITQDIAISALDSETEYAEIARQIREQKARFNAAVAALPGYSAYESDSLYSVMRVPEKETALINEISKKSDIRVRDYTTYYPELKNLFGVSVGPENITDVLIDLFQSASFCMSLRTPGNEGKTELTYRDEGYFVHKVVEKSEDGKNVGNLQVIILPSDEVKTCKVPVHQHREQQEIFSFKSDAKFILNGTTYSVKAGETIELKPGDFHGITSLPEKFARFIAQRWPYSDSDWFRPDGSTRS